MSEQQNGKAKHPGPLGRFTGSGPLLTVFLLAGPQIPGLVSRMFSASQPGIYAASNVYGGATLTLAAAVLLVWLVGKRSTEAQSQPRPDDTADADHPRGS
ncbi:hypothetical protein LOC59_13325 [Arthrobacter sp. zg-Y916]|uniref:Uncharacterized protein n=1 Tax=Arthrobacter caoxuetaonis TaxID=2886935 RepID=A0A9X1MH37_9MICC|nr:MULTISPECIES: hypothetical protein [Arthrobacter]MCC3299506.1 hypothetical protein [Arthrobacter caoxuetaonis]MCC9194622.1 hypothetical protein [Arthrobacter sp. zg-Y916]USQ57756.1 hypothetical protein NF551_02550 [Arthrobacter caoxuetaonis]